MVISSLRPMLGEVAIPTHGVMLLAMQALMEAKALRVLEIGYPRSSIEMLSLAWQGLLRAHVCRLEHHGLVLFLMSVKQKH